MVISHDVFERAARAQSNALRLSELRLIIYSQPKGEEEELEGAESARQVVSQLVDMVRETGV